MQGRYGEAEKIFERINRQESKELMHKDRMLARLALSCYGKQEYKKAEKLFKEVLDLRMKYFNPKTFYHYNMIKEKMIDCDIQLVCVQYPMRSILPLKKMLLPYNGIMFVDNEQAFKKAVKEEGYSAYFIDNFGGAFGHCTEKGNRLIAENIVKTMLAQGICAKRLSGKNIK